MKRRAIHVIQKERSKLDERKEHWFDVESGEEIAKDTSCQAGAQVTNLINVLDMALGDSVVVNIVHWDDGEPEPGPKHLPNKTLLHLRKVLRLDAIGQNLTGEVTFTRSKAPAGADLNAFAHEVLNRMEQLDPVLRHVEVEDRPASELMDMIVVVSI